MVGRLGTPDDIADVVRFLLSSVSSFVNATTLVADGGRMARVP
jgi:NAD(P)-dependent dehydrogenase (short-subunit alcohol dehydrogenase family)